MPKQETAKTFSVNTTASYLPQSTELHQDTQRLNQLNEMSHALVRAATTAELYNIALNAVANFMTADRVSIVRFDAEAEEAKVAAAAGNLPLAESYTGKCWPLHLFDMEYHDIEQVYYLNPDISKSDSDLHQWLAAEGLKSSLSVPLQAGSTVLGRLSVASTKKDGFAEQDAVILIQIASILAPMLLSNELLQSAKQRASGLESTDQGVVALREQEELRYFTQFAVDSTPQAIFWVSRSGKIINASQGACKMFRYTLAEFRGMHVSKIDASYTPRGGMAWERFRQKKRAIRESVFTSRDGTEIPVELQLSYMAYGEHELQLAIINDITERRQMEAQLRRQLKEEELLHNVLALTANRDNFETTMGQICLQMAKFLGIQRCGFALFNDDYGQAKVIAEYTTAKIPSALGLTFYTKRNLAIQHLLKTDDVVIIDNTRADATLAPEAIPRLDEFDIGSMLIVPVSISDKLVGSLGFDAGEQWEFTSRDIDLAKKVASQIGEALYRVRLLEQLTQTSHALENSKKNLSEALGKLLMPICIVNVDGVYLYANDAFGRMLKTTADHVMQNMIAPDIYVDPLDRQRLLDLLERDGEVVGFRVQFRKVTGETFWAGTSVYRLQYYGKPVLLSSVYDLSEQMQTEQILRDAKEAAEAANKTKSLFLSNMTHELRTPMNGVLGMTSLLLDTELHEKQQEIVNTIRSSGDTLLTIINDVLDFSKIEANKLELEEMTFELSTTVNECIQLVHPSILAKGLALTLQIEPDVPEWICQDVTRLRQVLTNLLTNATKFTERGQIAIRVSRQSISEPNALAQRASGAASAQKDNPSILLKFSVEDTGIGISQKYQDRLFQPFSQIDASMNRRYGGTGLGLVISKQLCELMGGDMWVESDIEQGSKFHFTIRATATASAAQQSVSPTHDKHTHAATPKSLPNSNAPSETKQPKPDTPDPHPLTILLAEDNVVNQKVALGILRKFGYSADVAANGIEALDALRRQSYDVILMDIQMPEMDGITATRRIRLDWPKHEQPFIIALTANAMKQQQQQYFDEGMDGFVSKPIRLPELTAALDQAAQHQLAQRQAAQHTPQNTPQNTDDTSRIGIS